MTRDQILVRLRQLVWYRPAGIDAVGLVMSSCTGWRRLVWLVALWALRRAGHDVVVAEAGEDMLQ